MTLAQNASWMVVPYSDQGCEGGLQQLWCNEKSQGMWREGDGQELEMGRCAPFPEDVAFVARLWTLAQS